MKDPVISIILPTRNRLDTISRTVDKIRRQTFADWELVVSDNHSDEPGKVDYLRDLAAMEDRVRVYFQDCNIGIHKNWRFCIERTRGRYYIPVTDDDWWGDDTFLESLLAMHDGVTASVFPNMCIHLLDTGEVLPDALSPVFEGVEDRFEFCERVLLDGRGSIMVGLIDLNVVSKEEVIAVIDNDLSTAIETVGMNRIAWRYPVKFCGAVSYHHSAYSGNYARSKEVEVLDQDAGIVTFQLLEELKELAREDARFDRVLLAQWSQARKYCESIAGRKRYQRMAIKSQGGVQKKVRDLEVELQEFGRQFSTMRGAVAAWWRNRSSRERAS